MPPGHFRAICRRSSRLSCQISDDQSNARQESGECPLFGLETGECYWVHEAGKPIWGSPLVADGKVYLGTGAQVLWVLAAGKQPKVINRIRMRDAVYTTPTAANGTLWVVTNRHLYAVGGGQGSGDRGQGAGDREQRNDENSRRLTAAGASRRE